MRQQSAPAVPPKHVANGKRLNYGATRMNALTKLSTAGKASTVSSDPHEPAVATSAAFGAFAPAVEYMIDAAQRSVLFWDVMRQRGNAYRKHLAETVPNVLEYKSELVVDGRKLERPVNYGLVRIVPPRGSRST